MLKVTDAEHLQISCIPLELAKSVGIFKDMIESLPPDNAEAEPVSAKLHMLLTERLFLTNHLKSWTCSWLGFSIARSL